MNESFASLNQELEEVKELQRKQIKLQSQLEGAQRSLVEQRQRLEQLEAQLQKESQDVLHLENKSLRAVFYTILGSKEEQLDKERQELLRAKLLQGQSRYAVESLTRDLESMRKELLALGDVQARYQAILQKKEDLLRSTQDEQYRRLVDLSETLAQVKAQQREVEEALAAGEEASRSLDEVIAATQSAENWGVWDILGGGMLATAGKHARIDDAQLAAARVQDQLRRFQRELADLQQQVGGISAEIGGLETFADFFLDGLIVDWIVQSKISQSLDNARETQKRVVQILDSLQKQKQALEHRRSQLSEARRQVIEQAE